MVSYDGVFEREVFECFCERFACIRLGLESSSLSALSKSNAMAVSRMSEWPSIIMPIEQERAVACESLDSEKEGK